eukprot:scaffold1130_cov74-Phaeocystis_antarctica.AAC.2
MALPLSHDVRMIPPKVGSHGVAFGSHVASTDDEVALGRPLLGPVSTAIVEWLFATQGNDVSPRRRQQATLVALGLDE